METAGIEIPEPRRGLDGRIVAVAITATAIAGMAGGYAVGTSSDATTDGVIIIARSDPATWDDALRESVLVKQHGRAAAKAAPIDIRLARVEK